MVEFSTPLYLYSIKLMVEFSIPLILYSLYYKFKTCNINDSVQYRNQCTNQGGYKIDSMYTDRN